MTNEQMPYKMADNTGNEYAGRLSEVLRGGFMLKLAKGNLFKASVAPLHHLGIHLIGKDPRYPLTGDEPRGRQPAAARFRYNGREHIIPFTNHKDFGTELANDADFVIAGYDSVVQWLFARGYQEGHEKYLLNGHFNSDDRETALEEEILQRSGTVKMGKHGNLAPGIILRANPTGYLVGACIDPDDTEVRSIEDLRGQTLRAANSRRLKVLKDSMTILAK